MKIKRFFSVLLASLLAVGAFALPASAAVKDTSRDVTLTIYALEAADGSEVTVDATVTGERVTITDKKPISGVTFNLYRVAESETSTDAPANVTPITSDATGADGSVKIVVPANAQGRYLVVENDKPDNCIGTTVPFLVDLPMTNPEGTDFIYDVFAYPKQEVQPDTDTEVPPDTDTDTSTDTDVPFVPDKPSVSKLVSSDGGLTYSDSVNIDAYHGGVATWKISAEVPSDIYLYHEYIIGDILDKRLIAPKASDIKAYVDGKALPSNSYTVTVSDRNIKVSFVPSKIEIYDGKSIDVIFDTPIDLNEDNVYGVKIQNIATLTYTDLLGGYTDIDNPNPSTDTDGSASTDNPSTDTDGSTDTSSTDTDTDTTDTTVTSTTITSTTVEVWTGEIDGYKHDKDNKPLSGAEFTLYSDKECKDVIATATSDKNGNFTFNGLLDGTYYLKETKAPNGYQLDSTVVEVVLKINEDSGRAIAKVDVLNIPKTKLPVTGGAGIIGITLGGFAVLACGLLMIYKALRLLIACKKAQPSLS